MRPSHLAESILFETVRSRESLSTSEEFRVQIYLPDKFLYKVNARFQGSNLVIMKEVSGCTPISSKFLTCTDLESFARCTLLVLGHWR